MLIRHRGVSPMVEPSAYVAPTAVIAGNVRVGPKARVMYGAVADSEGSRMEIGECSIIAENAVLRATASADVERPVVIKDHVFVGPHATLLGCTVESCSYIATGATVLHGAVVGKGAVIAVGALVHASTVVPEGFFLPPRAVAVGDPVRVFGPHEADAMVEAIKGVGFTKAAFNVEGKKKDRASVLKEAAEVRSGEFESHFEDRIIQG